MEKYEIIDQDYGIRGIKTWFFFSDYDTCSLYIREKEDFMKQTEYLYATSPYQKDH